MNDDVHRLSPPKQARALVTRTKIVDAAVTCLAELGHAGASTTAIAKKAGVSQGALFKHFPTKPTLLAAATDKTFRSMRQRFVRELIERRVEGRELEVGLEILWEIYRDARLKAVFELYLVTRTDEALRRVLEPVVTEHFVGIMEIAGVLFPGFVGSAPFHQAVMSLMLTLQGAALMDGVVPAEIRTQLPIDFFVETARVFLGSPDVDALTMKMGEI